MFITKCLIIHKLFDTWQQAGFVCAQNESIQLRREIGGNGIKKQGIRKKNLYIFCFLYIFTKSIKRCDAEILIPDKHYNIKNFNSDIRSPGKWLYTGSLLQVALLLIRWISYKTEIPSFPCTSIFVIKLGGAKN